MEKSRFTLLLLEPGEVYFEDFSSTMVDELNGEKVSGRLKLCSKSLLFEPHDTGKPIIKILLQNCDKIENSNNLLTVQSRQHAHLLTGNVIAPYIFNHVQKVFGFHLDYMLVEDCLSQILQLKRASTLPPPEQSAMIAAISHSRQSRLVFERSWLEDMYEQVVAEAPASKVSPLIVNPGRVLLSSTALYFQPFNNAESYPVLKIKLSSVRSVTLRRFLQRQVGMELTCEGAPVAHLYLAFKSEAERRGVYDVLLEQPALHLPPLKPELMTLKWQNRAIDNFEYLLYLNSLADRSVNDLTQYPVFPWVIADYSSPSLNLEDPQTLRDLSKPVGALNPERLQRLKRRREDMSPCGAGSFLYGSHYSAPAFVLFYLIRKFPEYMLCLQNGRFDHPDRIFHSVADVWKNVLNNMADFKELIPEFYDTNEGGQFLENVSGVALGTRHDGRRVHDVVLPPWCNGPEDFVKKLRNALESEQVSEALHHWIDLVFGWKQRGDPAEAADNVFYQLCYEGAVDLDAVADASERHALEVQIMEFGQIPKQIFKVPHPPRLKHTPLPPLQPPGVCRLRSRAVTLLGTHRDVITSLSSWGDSAVSAGRDSVLKEFNCASRQLIRSVHLDSAGISACVLLPGGVVILGTFDNRILVYDLSLSRVTDEVCAHEDAVSALCFCSASASAVGVLLSASWDGSLCLWPSVRNSSVTRLKATPITRFDLETRVTCAALNKGGQLAACGTEEGEVAVFRLSPPAPKPCLQVSAHGGAVTAVSIAEERVISCSSRGFQVHDVTSGLHVYSACEDLHITSLAWLGGLLLVGDQGGSLHCWDLNHVKPVETTTPTTTAAPLAALTVSPCGQFIITGNGKQVILLSSSNTA